MGSETEGDTSGTDTRHRVVVGVDGSRDAMAAVDWAATQAQLTGAVLEIVTTFGQGYGFLNPSEVERGMQNDIDQATARVERVAPSIDIITKTFAGSPGGFLIEESAPADLLVVGSRGRGGFRSLLLGSVSRRCVHRARCPVVVVGHHGSDDADDRGGQSEDRRAVNPGTDSDALETDTDTKEKVMTTTRTESAHRIVVGIDGSPSSLAALEWAADQAVLTGAALEVLMTWEWPIGIGFSPVPSGFDPAHDCETTLHKALAPVREAHPGVSVQGTVIEGHPAPLLVKASHGADLLVVGSRGHGEFTGMLLGSVS